MKRIISLVIAVLMIISTFVFSVNAAERSGVTFAVDELYRTETRLDSQRRARPPPRSESSRATIKAAPHRAMALRFAKTEIPSFGSAQIRAA